MVGEPLAHPFQNVGQRGPVVIETVPDLDQRAFLAEQAQHGRGLFGADPQFFQHILGVGRGEARALMGL